MDEMSVPTAPKIIFREIKDGELTEKYEIVSVDDNGNETTSIGTITTDVDPCFSSERITDHTKLEEIALKHDYRVCTFCFEKEPVKPETIAPLCLCVAICEDCLNKHLKGGN